MGEWISQLNDILLVTSNKKPGNMVSKVFTGRMLANLNTQRRPLVFYYFPHLIISVFLILCLFLLLCERVIFLSSIFFLPWTWARAGTVASCSTRKKHNIPTELGWLVYSREMAAETSWCVVTKHHLQSPAEGPPPCHPALHPYALLWKPSRS